MEPGNRFMESMPDELREKRGLGRMKEDEAAAAIEEVALWLERDAVSYERASDKEAADDKRALAEAVRGLVRGKGSADLRDEAVRYVEVMKAAEVQRGRGRRVTGIKEHTKAAERQNDRDRLIEYLQNLPL